MGSTAAGCQRRWRAHSILRWACPSNRNPIRRGAATSTTEAITSRLDLGRQAPRLNTLLVTSGFLGSFGGIQFAERLLHSTLSSLAQAAGGTHVTCSLRDTA